MRVLWITNIKLPPISETLGEEPTAVGGWMISSLNQLQKHSDLEIAVATFDKGNKLIETKVDGVRYFLVPTYGRKPHKYIRNLESEWLRIKEKFQPDIVHIHGTEFPHGLAWIKACGGNNVCISIQGLVCVYSRYYSTGSYLDYIPLTFRDFVKRDWIARQRNNFSKRGLYEIEMLKSVKHIIGRTEWDKSHAWAINPNAQYHFCGETLRDEFYHQKWQYDKCEPHSIFISQGNYPIKGLHIALKALPLILREYPDTKLYIGGANIDATPWFKKGSYAIIIKKLIKKYQLEDVVIFRGMMDEKQMCRQYLQSNVFLLASAIENSPNSLGEAQLLGVPIISTFCGGIPEIVNMNPRVLYRYEEYEMLAEKVCEIFSQGKEYIHPDFDKTRYDAEINTKTLISIYNNIYNRNERLKAYNKLDTTL